ncbi:MAG: BCCT family transporter [Steroidobacteraceae bacterium]
MKTSQAAAVRTDWIMFGATVAVIAGACLPLVLFREQAGPWVTAAYDVITRNFGVAYLWYGTGLLIFLLWLAASRFGSVRLGGKDAAPEFATRSWIAMLFCAGIGAGLLYWAVIEWGYYVDAPPLGVAPGSTEAIEWASTYGLFHWGLTGWAIFCLPTLAIAYPYHNRGVPFLRLSTGCLAFLPGGPASRRGRGLDFLYMINLIGGTGTSLGLSTPMIAAGLSRLFGIQHDFILEVAVVVGCIGVFGTSAWIGLQGGFRRMADANMYLALALLLFILLVGPTVFILKMATNSLGLMAQNFLRMNTWTDPISSRGFVESWTVFYWAWWIAYGPFVGIFVTRISRGRSLREVIIGMLAFGSLGAWLFFMVMGNYAMHLDLSGALDLRSLVKQGEEAIAITSAMASLPGGLLVLAVFVAVAVIFLATTYHSASYTLASVATRELPAGLDPARWHRVFWACALGLLPITLMFLEGGLKVILSATIVVSLPLVAVGILMCVSLTRMLRQDYSLTGSR